MPADTGEDATDAGVDAGDANTDASDAAMSDGGVHQEVVCGNSDDIIAFEEQLALLEDCHRFRGSIVLSDQRGARFLRGFSKLRVLEGDLNLFRNQELESLEGLENLQEVGGGIWLQRLPRLHELTPLSNLRQVGGPIFIESNPLLEDLEGLTSLRSAGGLSIGYNDTLRSLAELQSLERIRGRFEAVNNPMLPRAEIDALVDRVQIGGDVYIEP